MRTWRKEGFFVTEWAGMKHVVVSEFPSGNCRNCDVCRRWIKFKTPETLIVHNKPKKKVRKKEGKAIPLQPWTDPEGSRRLRLPDFKEIGT